MRRHTRYSGKISGGFPSVRSPSLGGWWSIVLVLQHGAITAPGIGMDRDGRSKRMIVKTVRSGASGPHHRRPAARYGSERVPFANVVGLNIVTSMTVMKMSCFQGWDVLPPTH